MDPGPSDQLQSLLRPDEELLWRATPRHLPIYVQHVLVTLLILVFLGPFFFGFVVLGLLVEEGLGLLLFLVPLYPLTSVVVGVPTAKLRVDRAEYAATDQRLIQFGGIVGRDYSSIKWENIRDVEVHVGVLDTLFGTGRVQFTVAGVGGPTGGGGVKFAFVDDPYEHLRRLQDILDRVETAPTSD